MAASVISKAQDILSCQLCQASSKIKWKCEDCEILMCDNCKEHIHTKVKTTYKHRVVDIRNLTSDEKTSIPNLNDIPCKIHLQRTCCLFCETCKQLICPTCISKTHQSHKMVELADIFQEKLNVLSFYLNELEILESTSRDVNETFEEQKTVIETREKILHETVSKYKTLLLNYLRESKKAITEDAEKDKHRIQHIIRDLEQRCTKIKSEKDAGRLENILSKETEIDKVMSIKISSAQKREANIKEFYEGTINHSMLENLFGSLQCPQQISIEIFFELVGTYRVKELPYPFGVVPISTTAAWSWHWSYEKLAYLQTTDKKLSVQTSVFITNSVYDFCRVDQSKYIMSVSKDASLYSFNSNDNEMKIIHTFNPLLPKALCVAGSEIIVGLRDGGEDWPLTDSSRRQVVVLSLDACVVRSVFEYDNNRKRVFTLPYRICSSKNNSQFYVLDSTSHETGRVITIDRLGQIRWFYDDPSAIPKFNPSGIVVTDPGKLVVGCFGQSNLYVLSKHGQILTKYSLNLMDVSWVSCLGLDQTGRLWVGGQDKKGKGCLRIVKVTGCWTRA